MSRKLEIQKITQKMDSVLDQINFIKSSKNIKDVLKLNKLKLKYKKLSEKRLRKKLNKKWSQ